MNNDNLNQNGVVLGSVNTNEPIDMLDVPNSEVMSNNTNNSVTPEPAYTNPQSISPAPNSEQSSTQPVNDTSLNDERNKTKTVAGFDGSIGMTPPVSLEPEKKPKKGMNKFVFVILIIVVLAGVGFGTYYLLNYTSILKKGSSITITPKTLKYNIGDDLPTNINDYVTIEGTDSKNCSLNTSNVNMQEVGTYTFKVTCGNKEENGTINVVDEREIEVSLKPVYKKIGDTIEAEEFANVIDGNYVYTFIDEEKVTEALNGEPGIYNIPIKVNTTSKSTEATGTLVLLKNDLKGFVDCVIKQEQLDELKATLTTSISFAIVNDGTNGFGGYAVERNVFKFDNENDYTNYLNSYKINNTLTINEITGSPSFDNAEFTITFDVSKVTAELNEEYGEENISNYKVILNHFKNELKYTCNYNKVERNEQ